MKTIEVTISSQGQVTIPVEVRRLLGLQKGDRVQFIVDDDARVRLTTPRYTMESVFGSVAGRPGLSVDLDDEIDAAIGDALAEKHGWSQSE